MKNNKKSISTIMIFVIVFAVVILMFMFRLILLKAMGDQYIVGTLTDAGTSILETYGRNDSVATIGQINTAYDIVSDIPYDKIFLFFWLISIVFTFIAAFQARKLSNFSFYGMLFVGSFLILVVIGFVEQFTGWFLNNFYNQLFSDLNLSTPIMNWYFTNMSLISYLWAIICLAINRLEIPVREIKGRPEE